MGGVVQPFNSKKIAVAVPIWPTRFKIGASVLIRDGDSGQPSAENKIVLKRGIQSGVRTGVSSRDLAEAT